MGNSESDKTGGLTEARKLKRAAEAEGYGIMVGCMLATSLAMAPGVLLAQGVPVVDLDGPLLLAEDREPGLKIEDSLVYPPAATLWGWSRRRHRVAKRNRCHDEEGCAGGDSAAVAGRCAGAGGELRGRPDLALSDPPGRGGFAPLHRPHRPRPRHPVDLSPLRRRPEPEAPALRRRRAGPIPDRKQ